MSKLILYAQQLVRNNNFALLSDYQWDITGTWVKTEGKITKSAGLGNIIQESVFTLGITYKLTYMVSGSSSTGTITVSDEVNTLDVQSANGTYSLEFVAAGQNLKFQANATFSAAISNVTVTT